MLLRKDVRFFLVALVIFGVGFFHYALYISPKSPWFISYLWFIRPAGLSPIFLPDITDYLEILLSPSLVSLSVLSKSSSHWLFCNILFLDLNEAVPETERLDSKALKTRAQLSVKNRRQRPSRTRLYDSVSSTDGEDSLERKVSTFDQFLPCSPELYTCSYSVLKVMIFFCNQILCPRWKQLE